MPANYWKTFLPLNNPVHYILNNRMSQNQSYPSENFSTTTLPVVGKKVFRMGIAGNYGLQSEDIEWAADHGANYWVWGTSFKNVAPGLRRIIRQDRDKHVVAMLGRGLFPRQVRKSIENALRTLQTDYLDVFKLGWLGRTSFYRRSIVDTLLDLKQEGKIRAIGTSIHDRKRAGQLAIDSEIDLFMIRYNAKHPGAEQDIFPHLSARNPAVVAYTALAWGQLIRPYKNLEIEPWPGNETNIPPLTPELCYRFVLSNPHVHLVLTGPKNREQLRQNLLAIEHGPLKQAQLDWVRQYGRLLRKKKRFDYIP